MINFPSSPAEGQVHNASPGVSFVFRSGSWQQALLKTARPKNYLVNPALQVSQQNGDLQSAPAASGNTYPADQWWHNFSVVGNSISSQRYASTALPEGSPYAMQMHNNTAKPTLAASDYMQMMQHIEGSRTADLQWGTANAVQCILRFGVASAVTGSFCVRVSNATTNRCYLALFPATGSWTMISLVIPGDTTGTWATDNTTGIVIAIIPVAASNLYGAAGWNAGNFVGLAGMANAASVVGAFYLTSLGFYADPYKTGVAPPFVVPSYSDELARCQRYWYKGFSAKGLCPNTTTFNAAAMEHPVPMRIKPALTLGGAPRAHDVTNAVNITSISANQSTSNTLEYNSAATPQVAGRASLQLFDTAANYIAANARM